MHVLAYLLTHALRNSLTCAQIYTDIINIFMHVLAAMARDSRE